MGQNYLTIKRDARLVAIAFSNFFCIILKVLSKVFILLIFDFLLEELQLTRFHLAVRVF